MKKRLITIIIHINLLASELLQARVRHANTFYTNIIIELFLFTFP